MSLGRIRRGSAEARRRKRLGASIRKVRVTVEVARTISSKRYYAYACLGQRGGLHPRRCTRSQYARSPQSAIAKALKALSSKVAKRGRR